MLIIQWLYGSPLVDGNDAIPLLYSLAFVGSCPSAGQRRPLAAWRCNLGRTQEGEDGAALSHGALAPLLLPGPSRMPPHGFQRLPELPMRCMSARINRCTHPPGSYGSPFSLRLCCFRAFRGLFRLILSPTTIVNCRYDAALIPGGYAASYYPDLNLCGDLGD